MMRYQGKRGLCLVLALALALAGCAAPADSTAADASPTPTAKPDKGGIHTMAESNEPGEVPTVLPETKDASRTYIDETLFIGDSNTARYTMYADETGEPFTTLDNNIGVVSMGVGSITDLKCERFKGYKGMYTLPDAVAMLKPKRIIIGFGTNNLSGSSTDASKFISTYKKGLAAIAKAWPYCDIIVNAIPPLDKLRDNTNLTMTQVDAYNEALVKMCEEEGYHFLNTAEVLRDEKTGWAKKDYTLSDGVHLSKIAVTALFEYVRTHAYITEDRRPQPLGKIPKPDGVPLGLISQDPIAVRGKVPVEFVASTGGHIKGETSQMVKKGATCSPVEAVPEEGYKFSHWSASLGKVSGGASLTFTMPSDADANGVIVTAHFEAEVHEHDLDEVPGTRVEPTCGADGTVKTKCSICGQVFEQTLKATGQHTWDGKSYTLQEAEAGGSERLKKLVGKTVRKCKVCGYIDLDPNAKQPDTEASPVPTASEAPSGGGQTQTPVPTATKAPEGGGDTGSGSGGDGGGGGGSTATEAPTNPPTQAPTNPPTQAPTEAPTAPPTEAPTENPTEVPVQDDGGGE